MQGGSGTTYDVIIIGGGHNGLVAAFYLAQAGLRTLVLERRNFVGGACTTEELFPGYRISSCSYICWMLHPTIIHDMQLERHGFRYETLNPLQFNPYQDGSFMFIWDDQARTVEEIRRLNPHDAETYPAWQEFWHRAAGLVYPFLLQPPPTLGQVLDHARQVGEEALLEKLLTTPLASICHEYFDDTRVQAALVQVEDIGNPWAVGSAWVETYFHCSSHMDFGYAVVTGGMGAITQAMAQAAQEKGADIRCGASVERILVQNDRVIGVRLESGEEIQAGIVVSNADPKRTYLDLIEPGLLSMAFCKRVEGLSTRTSYLKFHSVMDRLPDVSHYLGREAEPREVGYIHIAPSLDHYRLAHEQIERGEPAQEPIVHIQIPTVYDSTLTSKQGHIVSIWVLYAPPRLAYGTWEEHRQEVGEALIDYITEFIPNFRRDIREWLLFTPYDLEQRIALTDGNIRHLDMIPQQFLDQRPFKGSGYASPLKGLYLCGAGTHPGGEVTGAPGYNAAQAVLQQLRGIGKGHVQRM